MTREKNLFVKFKFQGEEVAFPRPDFYGISDLSNCYFGNFLIISSFMYYRRINYEKEIVANFSVYRSIT